MIRRQEAHRYFNAQLPCGEARLALIGWMESLCGMLEFRSATLHAAVAILDVLLSLTTIEHSRLKLVAYVCVSLGGKMEEPSTKLPTLADVSRLFQDAYTVEDFANCEQVVFSVLGCSAAITTPYAFAAHFVHRGALHTAELNGRSQTAVLADFAELQEFCIRASLDVYALYQYSSLAVGAAVIACTRKYLGLAVYWPENLAQLSGVYWQSINECFNVLDEIVHEMYEERLNGTSIDSSLSSMQQETVSPYKRSDSATEVSSSGDSVVITEFECLASDDENLFGDSHTVILKFNV